ncbi:MAG: O-antigen ligase family protein [Spirochaetes bacterium]|nr:O-antigen ligase family protein [Spirochaetota bacterium]
MPPNVAAIICYIFIVSLIIDDIKKYKEVSIISFIPFIWMFISGSKSIYRWLNPDSVNTLETTQDIISGSLIDRQVLILLIIIGVIILIYRKLNWFEIIKNNFWLLMLLLYLLVSVLWSELRFVSLKRWIRVFGVLIMILVILTEKNPEETVKALFRRLAYILIPLSVLYIKYYRHIGIAYTTDGSTAMWVGVSNHKNSLGQLTLVCAFFFIWNILNKWKNESIKIDLIILIMCLWILRGSSTSRSNTSIFVLIIGLLILFLLYFEVLKFQKVERYFLIFFIIYYVINIFTNLFFNSSLLALVIGASGRDLTLTGRTILWDEVIKIAKNHFLFGVGYGSFWIGSSVFHLWEVFNWLPTQAHNGYVDIFAEVGIVGLIITIFTLISSYISLRKKFYINKKYYAFIFSFYLMILFYNITESSLLKPMSFLWFCFLLVAVNVPKKNYT